MKNVIITFCLLFSFANISFSKEVNLSCDLSHFFTKKNVMDDLQQIPLSKLESKYLTKLTLSFDVENKKFLKSNLIYTNEYKSIIFDDDEIFFITKGFYNNKDSFYYDTRLNRLSGELIRVTKVTESYVRRKLEIPNADTGFGWEQKKVYQCKLVDKLF